MNPITLNPYIPNWDETLLGSSGVFPLYQVSSLHGWSGLKDVFLARQIIKNKSCDLAPHSNPHKNSSTLWYKKYVGIEPHPPNQHKAKQF